MDESSNPWCGAARPRGPTPENSLRLKTRVCPTSLSLWEQGEGTEEQFGGGYPRSGLCTVTAASVQPRGYPAHATADSQGNSLTWAEQGFAPPQPAGEAQLRGRNGASLPLGTAGQLSPGAHASVPLHNAPEPNPARNQSCKHIPNPIWLACSSVHLHTVSLLLFSNNIHLSWRKGQRYHHLRLWKDKKILLYSMLPLAFYTYPPSC